MLANLIILYIDFESIKKYLLAGKKIVVLGCFQQFMLRLRNMVMKISS